MMSILAATLLTLVVASPASSVDSREYIRTSYRHIHRIFIDHNSRLTDFQQDERWKEFSGKWVRWTGFVREVGITWGDPSVKVDMEIGSVGPDVSLSPTKAAWEKAKLLQKGDRIFFSGRLDRRPGKLLSMWLRDAEIIEPTSLSDFCPLTFRLQKTSIGLPDKEAYRAIFGTSTSYDRVLTAINKAVRQRKAVILPSDLAVTLTGRFYGCVSEVIIAELPAPCWIPNTALRAVGLVISDGPEE